MRRHVYYRRAAQKFLAGSRFKAPFELVHAGLKSLKEWTDLLNLERDLDEINRLQHLAQCLTLRVKHWRPTGVATDSGFHRSDSAERVNGYENRCNTPKSSLEVVAGSGSWATLVVKTPFFLKYFPVEREVILVLLGITKPPVWNIVFAKNCRNWADWHTRAAINTFFRMNKQLYPITIFTLHWVNPFHWADVNAGTVFDSNTRFTNDVWHVNLLEKDQIGISSKFKHWALLLNYDLSGR
jgi:hypothetical protein